MVSVSVSIFETKDKSASISLNFLDQFLKSQSQSQNLIPISKVSVSVSQIETGYTESQSQHAKTGLAHPCLGFKEILGPKKIGSKKNLGTKYL